MSTVQDSSNVTSLFGAAPAAANKNSTQETQNRFLSLLVAQMKNQDPLNPLDNAQVTSQMAQLSTVQGIENMNKSLEALAASMGVNQMSQAANLIGHAVLVPGDRLSPAELQDVIGFELSRPADNVTVSIQDAAGNTVRNLNLGPRESGINVLAWDGMTNGGIAAPAGEYSFKVNALQAGQTVSNIALSLGMVNSVSQNSQGVQLNLAGNKSAGYADIRQIF
ncbi:MAG: flagellar hook assembly protein FlgD [Thiobacillus sp.]|nr:flagellar hook assembly protein FlgD [Thiobacillus sp.]